MQQFADVRECASESQAPVLGGKVCDYSYIRAYPSSGGVWSRNAVTELNAGFDFHRQSAFADEMDINNAAGDYQDFAHANAVALLINGMGRMNTAAISIQTGNQTSPMPIWYNGVYLGPHSIDAYGFRDMSGSATSVRIEGDHSGAGIDLASARTGVMGVLLAPGSRQGLGVRLRDGAVAALVWADPDGEVHVGPDGASARGVRSQHADREVISMTGHLSVSTPRPTLSNCGQGAALSQTANDVHGTVTEGRADRCTVLFSAPFTTRPDCVISSPSGAPAPEYSVTTTALTFRHTEQLGQSYTYQCLQ
ncbi:hypothetical protein [Gluconobacter sp. DsW_058]|uniref:hypothetical protein n=1 Tax=Gluconobacter sp. DsW_058 TaxID=1511210 RepID=UPI00117A3339|nr:hypothetical protein [Gluconobacter sp. DsW_058]